MRRFEFSDSTSNNFWEVDVKGKTLILTFGEIGTNGQRELKDFATPEKANAEMEKLIKDKTDIWYLEIAVKEVEAADPAAGQKSSVSMGEGLSKVENQTKAEKVLLMFACGQLEMVRGILEAVQDEHWLFEELLEGSKIEDGKPMPSAFMQKAYTEKEKNKAELVMLEVLLYLPKELADLQKLKEKLGIKINLEILSKYWSEVAKGWFNYVKYGDPKDFSNRWYEEREVEIARVEKECEVRCKSLNMPWTIEENLDPRIKLEVVLIPAGKFLMGSPKYEKGRDDNETQHKVMVTKPFYMGKYEVTQEQWAAVMGFNPSYCNGSKLPVTNVSWEDCQEFIRKLNAKTNGGYRLPKEAEWEYACRAGTSTAYSFGAKISPQNANYVDSRVGKPLAVGRFKPNAFGLYDMHGNVWEWCEDGEGNYPTGAVKDPEGPAIESGGSCRRVLRGGSFNDFESDVRSSARINVTDYNQYKFNGFRLARTEVAYQVTTKKVKNEKAAIVLSPAAGKKTNAGSVGEGLSKAEKQAKAEKVLLMFAGGQWELARGILEAAQEEHWLFEELLEGCSVKKDKPTFSTLIKKAFSRKESGKAELSMFEVLLHLPKELEELQKLREELGIQIKANMLSKYWKEVAEDRFSGVKYGDPGFFTDQWYEARESEITKVEKECEARSKALNKAWREEEDLGNGIKLEMVLIPAGKFEMGSPASEKGRSKAETQHQVTLTKSYYMGKYEVTQEQWEAVMGKNPSSTMGARLPVMDVSWEDCQVFIKKLNGINKGKYRLPTEAEWEYACRAGTSTAYSFGAKITPKDANYDDSKLGKPVEVGSYKPNAFGLYDMHGNMWEWCEDWKADYPKEAVTDPKGPATGEDRVLRGGSFLYFGSIARSFNRYSYFAAPTYRVVSGGLRLARTAL